MWSRTRMWSASYCGRWTFVEVYLKTPLEGFIELQGDAPPTKVPSI